MPDHRLSDSTKGLIFTMFDLAKLQLVPYSSILGVLVLVLYFLG
jgi:hypothetical protein